MYFLDLPDEILDHIIHHLECDSEVNLLAQTNHRLHRIASGLLCERQPAINEKELREAVCEGHVSTVRWLLNNGTLSAGQHTSSNELDPGNESSIDIENLIIAAVENNHPDILLFLLRNSDRERLRCHSSRIARYLQIHMHLDFTTECREKLPLKRNLAIEEAGTHESLPREHNAMALLLELRPELNVNLTYANRSTMMMEAMWRLESPLRLVAMLYQHGADPSIANFNGDTVMTLAAKYGHLDVVRFLLENGVRPDPVRYNGSSLGPLLFAAEWGHSEIVALLLEHIDIKSKISSAMEQQWLLIAGAAIGKYNLVEAVLACGCCPNTRINKYESERHRCRGPLSWTAKRGDKAMMQLLLEHGADPTGAAEVPVNWPILQAVVRGYADIVDLLLDHGVNPNDEKFISTKKPLLAWAEPHPEVFQLLLRRGANPHFQYKCQHSERMITPLISVLRARNYTLIQIMKDEGVKLRKGVVQSVKTRYTGSRDSIGIL
ncbi:hypothetical protein N7457_005373 [Penicillium paradoxum]|uniref:uncharacterized protein n=1 Tax=Penicillium paradoxum TaxID=176176 RepID=UPI002549709F|nr:uncharacterized protein N7457_005373 [Penicillium paradoxum]KAJ5780213.1 hypothetical protein N7457_005373 [Penicillium paradoxum]